MKQYYEHDFKGTFIYLEWLNIKFPQTKIHASRLHVTIQSWSIMNDPFHDLVGMNETEHVLKNKTKYPEWLKHDGPQIQIKNGYIGP